MADYVVNAAETATAKERFSIADYPVWVDETATAQETTAFETTTYISGVATLNEREKRVKFVFGFAGHDSYTRPPADASITVELVNHAGGTLAQQNLDQFTPREDYSYLVQFVTSAQRDLAVRVSVTGPTRFATATFPVYFEQLKVPYPTNSLRRP